MTNCFRLMLLVGIILTSFSFSFSQDAPEPPARGTISGTVLDDSTGLPIDEAVVRFFKPHGLWVAHVHTDTAGYYEADLDSGRYLVRYEKFGYLPEWFDDVREVRDAFVVNLHEDTTLAVNSSLRPMERPNPATVTGTVTDSATGLPLRNSFVALMRPHRWLRQLQHLTNLLGGFPFERFHFPGLGRLHGVVWVGLTDSAGNYVATVPKGARYIAFAFKPGYLPQFYDHKVTPFDADRIAIMGDTSGIDFELEANPLAVNDLAGRVVDTTGTGVASHVVLIRIRPNGWIPVRYQATDSSGNYRFQHLVPGRFLVRAIPTDNFGPAWYKEGECGIRDWHNADVIDLLASRNDVEVCVRALRDDGFCHIDGQISNSSNLLSAAAQEGVGVYAVSTSSGEVVGYDVTEEDGSFSIENLPPDSYSIVVDKEGITPTSAPTVTVDESNSFAASGVGIGVTVDPPLDVTERNPGLPLVFALAQNFPNPFNPSTEMRMDVAQMSNLTVKVYNIIGQEIAILLEGASQPGSYLVRWDGRDHRGVGASSGVYFVKYVATPTDGVTPSFTQIRKITLLK